MKVRNMENYALAFIIGLYFIQGKIIAKTLHLRRTKAANTVEFLLANEYTIPLRIV